MANLMHWAGDPLAFFPTAYGSALIPRLSPWRVLGWLVVLAGVVSGWWSRHPTPHAALLRFMSVLVPLQVAALWLVARDLHHLVVTAPMVAILAGLSISTLASTVSPPRGIARTWTALLLALPWLIVGIQDARRTDEALATIPVVTFTESGQQALLTLLRGHDVERLGACDYELYGVLETRAPDIEVVHGWGAASRARGEALPGLLEQVVGGHYLVLNASAPMIYNLRPSAGALSDAAAAVGLQVEEVGRIEGAVLYSVGRP